MTPLEEEAHEVICFIRDCFTHNTSRARFMELMTMIRDFLMHYEDKRFGYKSFHVGSRGKK